MTSFNPPLYNFPNVDFNPSIYEQGTTYTLVSGGASLTGNNTWLGKNTFSNVAGIATNLVDSITATTLSIGTSLANAISIGSSTFMTTILGNLTVNGTTTLTGASTAPTVTYPSNTTNIATTAYVTSAVAAGGGVSLSGNNTWTGTNNFSNALGVITSYIDRLAAGVLSIGTTVASSITLGAAAIPTNIKGALTVGAGSNTIAINANSGLNQLLLTGSAGTSGQVLQSGGSAGSLSWATGSGGVSLAGTNTWTAMNTFSGGLTMGGSNNITLGSGTVAPALGQIGYVGYGNAGGYFTQNFKTGSTDYVYGAVLLPTGTYMFSVYISLNTTFTYLRTVIQTGTSASANGTLSSTFSPGYTFPSNGGNGIITLTTGFTVVGGLAPEYTSFGVGTITSALPYIGLVVNLGGAGATIAGIYSLQYMRIA